MMMEDTQEKNTELGQPASERKGPVVGQGHTSQGVPT